MVQRRVAVKSAQRQAGRPKGSAMTVTFELDGQEPPR